MEAPLSSLSSRLWRLGSGPWGIGAAVAVLAVLTAVQVLPPVGHWGDQFATNPGDPAFLMWQMSQQAHAAAGHPGDLLQGNIFAGHADAVAYSDNLLAYVPVFGPALWLAGNNPIAAYNATAFLLLLAGAVAVSALALHLLGSRLAAFAAGVLVTTAPYREIELLSHLQLAGFVFVPLGILALMRVCERPRVRDGVLLGLAAGLCWLGSLYCAMMLAVVLPVMVVAWAAQRRFRLPRALLAPVLTAIGVAALCVLPTLPAYLGVQKTGANTRSVDELITVQLAELRHLPPSPLWRLLGASATVPGEQDMLFPGLVLLGLAAVGTVVLVMALLRRPPWRGAAAEAPTGEGVDAVEAGLDERRRVWTIPLLAAAAACLAVMIGPRHNLLVSLPDRVLRAGIPGMADLRDLVRFWLVVLTVITLAAGAGVVWLMRRVGGGWRGAALVAALLAVSVAETSYRLDSASVALDGPKTAVNHALHDLPAGTVVELPLDPPFSLPYSLAVAPRQLRSTIDGQTRLEGYSGNMPTDTRAAVETARLLPDPAALATLHALGVRYIVLHGGAGACWGEYSPDELRTMVGALTSAAGVVRTVPAGPDVIVVLDGAPPTLQLNAVPMPAVTAPSRNAAGCDLG